MEAEKSEFEKWLSDKFPMPVNKLHPDSIGGAMHELAWLSWRASRRAAFDGIAEKLRKAGATLPAQEPKGNIESAMMTGLSIALSLIENDSREE